MAAAHDVNLARIAGNGIDAAGLAQRLVERQAAVAQRQRPGRGDFAQHIHLGVLAAGHAHQIAGGQQDARRVHAQRAELRQVDQAGGAAARHGDRGPVGQRRQPASAADGFRQRHRNVVDGLQAGRAHFAIDIDAPGPVGLNAQRDLRIFEELGQTAGQRHLGLLLRQAAHLEGAEQGKLDQPLWADVVAVADRGQPGGVRRQRRACRRQHQFGVVPDDDIDHVAGANAVGLGLRKQALHAAANFSVAQGVLPGDQFGRDTEQGAGWRRVATGHRRSRAGFW